jgi:thiamine-monophosphate kinase
MGPSLSRDAGEAPGAMSGHSLGEFGRIRRFFAPLAGPGGLGLTDDAALVDCRPGQRLVMTVDAMVAGVHYLPDDPPDLVARKLLRVNLSDLAAMGARPRHYLLTTALPKSLDDDWVARFAAGLAEDQKIYGVDLLGGDSVATPGPAALTLTAVGEVVAGAEIRRKGARPGDRVWVSGTIGDAFLGLKVLRGEFPNLAAADSAALVGRFRLPEPRVALGPRLAGIAHAMCDVSDGLLADLGHISEASMVGATVRLAALPLSSAARRLVEAAPGLAASLATGGDDYELLFAAAPEAGAAIGRLAAELKLPITEIGAIEPGDSVRLVDAAGNEIPVATAGWRHF